MRKIDLPQSLTYDPVGRCIYCAATSPLSREHIIPLSLGGEVILPESSCPDCQSEIKKYEAPCLNRTYIQARTFLKLPMYDQKYRPTDLRVGRFRGEEDWPDLTDNFRFETAPVDQHPAVISSPILEPPGLLVDRGPEGVFRLKGTSHHVLNAWSVHTNQETGERGAIFTPFDPDKICRFVAKIAHGSVTALLGLDTFEPLLTDIIRNRADAVSSLVGGPLRTRWPARKELHRVHIGVQQGYIVATVQLFSRYAITPFLVVAGTPKGSPSHLSTRYRLTPAP